MLPEDRADEAELGILLSGTLRKLKRMKKKYFILFGDRDQNPARLEYFDSEKKWRNGQAPKRSIQIRSCFNINRRSDGKSKFVVALYTDVDCFPIVFETEEELLKWFLTLLKIQLAGQVAEGEELKPRYEHLWQVTVTSKELGGKKKMVGPHRLCLTARILTLFRMPLTNPPEMWEFPVMTIRRCGHINNTFFMEMGRGTVTGAGELWMELEDSTIAQNMHAAIIEAMRNSAKEDVAPRVRTRSLSTNERPVAWQNNPATPSSSAQQQQSTRSRADSCNAPSRSRTSSEVIVTPPDGAYQFHHHEEVAASPPPMMASSTGSQLHSEGSVASASFLMDEFDTNNSHPHTSNSSAYSRYHQNRFSRTATPENSLPKDATILEEDGAQDYLTMNYGQQQQQQAVSDYLTMTPQPPAYSSSPSAHAVSAGRAVACPSRATKPRPGPPPIKPPLHQNPYMEMASPTAASWSSPPNVAQDGYMPMYPLGYASGPGSVGTRSGTHTRSSSFCEDVTDGSYVPMAPQSVASNASSRDEDVTSSSSYMDMQIPRRSVPKDVQLPPHGGRGRTSPASCSSLASSLSMTSGTPPHSRFAEYHLEKVASLLTPSEDDRDSVSSLKCRTSRAYSVGARPDIRLRKLAVLDQHPPAPVAAPSPISQTAHLHQGLSDSRVRAYSVGSRGGPVSGSPNPPSSRNSSINSSRNELLEQLESSPSTMAIHQQQDDNQRKKSMSVPVLGSPGGGPNYSTRNPTGTFLRTVLAHQSAARRDNDLMEIEFANGLGGNGGGIDTTDSGGGNFGSTDSVGASSIASTNSGGGRPRSASNNSRRPAQRSSGAVKAKESFRTRPGSKLERLESVPQGRDQDYIEYGQQMLNNSLGSPSAELSSPRILGDHDSADEYVELAKPVSSRSNSRSATRLSIPDGPAGGSSGVPSPLPGSDYLVMDYGKNSSVIASLNTVLCQIAKEPGNASSSSYMDMNYNKSQPMSQAASVSDNESYLPMDFTPKSSRNPSRQSSQADLILALGAFSPSTSSHRGGSQTPRSESARHSRTEESLLPSNHPAEEDQPYMEMTFESNQSTRSSRNRGYSPYSPDALTDTEPSVTPPAKSGNKASAFLSNLLGIKSSSAKSAEGGTLPRPSRSMPPSPFSSLKRTKSTSSKKKRLSSTSAAVPLPISSAQSLSPDAEGPGFYHQRSQSLRLHSPLTPPSPTADFVNSRMMMPLEQSTPKPSSSQPISIRSMPNSSGYHPRGSPVVVSNLRPYDPHHPDGYAPVPHRTSFSSSPGRLVTMVPTLSPLPEVLCTNHPLKPPDSGYVNMDFSPKPSLPAAEVPLGPPEPSQPVRIPMKGSSTEDNKENTNAAVRPVTKPFELTVTPVEPVGASAVPAAAVAAPSKQRANSLEKIVCAFSEKVKIGPKRHSSGDKPMKRTTGTLIYRSNSYQPSSSSSRVVVAGSKPVSLFPLTDIVAGKVMGNEVKTPLGPQRTSSSSLASLGEDLVAGELQAVHWQGVDPSRTSPSTAHSSPSAGASSPSPSTVGSRPVSAQSEREINYAQLDLAPVPDEVEVVPKSPRNHSRGSTTSTTSFPELTTGTSYAQIDFTKK